MNALKEKKEGTISAMDKRINKKTGKIQKCLSDSGDTEIVMQQIEEECFVRTFDLHLGRLLLLILLIGSAFLGGVCWKENCYRSEEYVSLAALVYPEKEESEAFIMDENGFVFSDSSERYLSSQEIALLKDCEEYSYKDLIRYSINEIYARHGYHFEEGGKYWNHYSLFSWYSEMPKQHVTYEMLNEYERANIDLLVKAEIENGFRK